MSPSLSLLRAQHNPYSLKSNQLLPLEPQRVARKSNDRSDNKDYILTAYALDSMHTVHRAFYPNSYRSVNRQIYLTCHQQAHKV